MQTVLVDDHAQSNLAMIRELKLLGDADAVAFETADECVRFHETQSMDSEIHYVVDLDLGKGREVEGVRLVKKLRSSIQPTQTILISALSSHTDLKGRALQAGADSFIPKTGHSSDAREVRLRELHHDVDVSEAEARALEKGLAAQRYAEFLRQFTLARKRELSTEAVQDGIRKLLGYRYLEEPAIEILSALDQWLVECAPDQLSDWDYRFCRRAIRLLKADDEEGMRRWIQRAHVEDADVLLPWLETQDPVEDLNDGWGDEESGESRPG